MYADTRRRRNATACPTLQQCVHLEHWRTIKRPLSARVPHAWMVPRMISCAVRLAACTMRHVAFTNTCLDEGSNVFGSQICIVGPPKLPQDHGMVALRCHGHASQDNRPHALRAIHKSWSCGHGSGGLPSVQRPSGFAVAGLCPWSSRGSPGSRWRVHGLAIPFPASFGLCSMEDLIQREWSCYFAQNC